MSRPLCVSAEASFGLAGILVPVGIYCLKTASERDRSSIPLAALPVIFAFQQCCEGLVWVGIGRANGPLTHLAALAYLFFAFTFWLCWIPLSAYCLESRPGVKVLLGLAALLGLTGGLAFYLPLLAPDVLVVSVDQRSLRYDFAQSPALKAVPQLAWQFAYLAVVSVPLLLVGQQKKGVLVLGTAIVVSAAISHAYFWYAYTSMWCLFAALLSMILAYVFYRLPVAMRATRRATEGPIEPIPTRIADALK